MDPGSSTYTIRGTEPIFPTPPQARTPGMFSPKRERSNPPPPTGRGGAYGPAAVGSSSSSAFAGPLPPGFGGNAFQVPVNAPGFGPLGHPPPSRAPPRETGEDSGSWMEVDSSVRDGLREAIRQSQADHEQSKDLAEVDVSELNPFARANLGIDQDAEKIWVSAEGAQSLFGAPLAEVFGAKNIKTRPWQDASPTTTTSNQVSGAESSRSFPAQTQVHPPSVFLGGAQAPKPDPSSAQRSSPLMEEIHDWVWNGLAWTWTVVGARWMPQPLASAPTVSQEKAPLLPGTP